MSNPFGISLKQVASSSDENERNIDQIIKIGDLAKDHFLSDRRLGVYEGCFNGAPAKVHISNGLPINNKNMTLRFKTLQGFTDNNILHVHALSEVEMPLKDGKKSEGRAMIFASQNFVSNLNNFLLGPSSSSLFVKHEADCEDKGCEMGGNLQKIVWDIGKTLNIICAKYSIKHPRLREIFLREGSDGYVALFGNVNIEVTETEVISSSKHWAYLIETIYETANQKQSDTISDFIELLSSNDKIRIGEKYFKHPLFLTSEQKIELIYDIVAYKTSLDPEGVLWKYKWPDESLLNGLEKKRSYKHDFMGFILFIRDKLEHFDEVKPKSKFGHTKVEFLQYVERKVPYFWAAIGRVVVCSK